MTASNDDPKHPEATRPVHHPTLFERTRRTFLAGILVIVPAFVAIYAVVLLMRITDGMFGGIIDQVWLLYFQEPPAGSPAYRSAKGILSFFMALSVVMVIGWASTFWLVRKVITIGEAIVNKLPGVKFFYNTPKEVINTLTMPRKGSAKRVVMIEYPRRGIWCFAFATGELRKQPDGTELVSVFLPTTPNPTSGFLLYLPTSDIFDTNIPVELGARMIISGGILGPEEVYTQKFCGLDRVPDLPAPPLSELPPELVEQLNNNTPKEKS